jgi:NAD(P)H-nitrite reductase large subunit
MEYAIIGNSVAAVGCIEGIRAVDKEGNITVISDEKEPCYSRPLISYYLMGKTTNEHLVYRDATWFSQMHVTQKLGTKVTAIDPKTKILSTDNAGTIPYDKLLVSTGSRAFVPPMQHLEKVKRQFTFMTIEDAKALEKAVTIESEVLIIGAGLIGLKCAEGLYHRVKHITIVDLAPRVLPTILDEEGSMRVQRYLESMGMTFILEQSAKDFSEHEATLTDGRNIGFDVLVLAVGVRPNTALLKDSGGEVNKGIVIDEKCRTTLSDIWAAGDCTEGMDDASGTKHIIAIFPNARLQGEAAGKNMAGEETSVSPTIAMNATGLFDLHMITAGSYSGEDIVEKTESGYKRLFTKEDRLVGFILVGDTIARAGIYTSLIRNKTDLKTIDFAMISEHPQLMAFAKKDRARKLGGVQ